MEQLHLGGGCFWCTEGGLLGLRGVHEVVPGYSGGHVDNPTSVSYTHLTLPTIYSV